MKWTIWTCAISSCLLSGCDQQEPPILDDPVLFCDVEEPRRFSVEEWAWRSENAPWNLRRDVKTNTTWDRECVEPES